MADDRAIMTVCEAVVGVLREAAPARGFQADLDFRVFLAKDFTAPMSAGVSLFLYRVYPNGTARRPPGRLSPDGERMRPQLPVDLHFLLTPWAGEASLQHALLGWL